MIRFQSIKQPRSFRISPLIALSCIIAFFSLTVHGGAGSESASRHSAPHIEVSLVSEVETVKPGTPFQVAARLAPDPGWHTYWRNPGDTGLATRIDWTLARGEKAGPIQWPPPERIDYQGMINYGYHGETLLLTTITPPDDIRPGEVYPVKADVHWLICKDICIPGSGTVATSLEVTGGSPEPGPWSDRIAAVRAHLPQTLEPDTTSFHLDDKLVLALPGATDLVPSGEQVRFFPIDPDIVDNTVVPRIRYRHDELLIQTLRNPDFGGPPPATLDGLLVIGGKENARSYRFTGSASPSPIAFPIPPDRQFDGSLIYILLLAFVGGFILNLMPCVFPVLSIKILSLIKSGGHNPRQRKLHGFAYTGGILVSILIFAAVLLSIRAAGEAVGWGFQLQSPWFVATLVYILFVMGLSLSGYVNIGTSLTRAGNLLDRHQGLTGSFFNGTLATVVATPCTVPFMATAVGFAMTQSIAIALLVFIILGLGLASPFLLVAFVPALADRLPKPGRWMETLKQFLAFPLYFTVIWLLWVLNRQTNSDITALVMVGMVLLGLGLWLWSLAAQSRRTILPRGLAVLTLITALALLPGIITPADVEKPVSVKTEDHGYPAMTYSESRVRKALADNRTVFINVNADWCITCKVNERIALTDEAVRQAFRDRNVLYLVGDWTDGDETLSRLLTRFGRSGVPLYLLYRPGETEPQILPQLLTPGTVIEALEG